MDSTIMRRSGRDDVTQFRQLVAPFPDSLIESVNKSGRQEADYVNHAQITQRALSIVGPYTQRVVEVIRGHALEVKTRSGTVYPERSTAVVGVILELVVEIDGRQVVIQEAGAEGTPAMHNDAENLKNAISDALKRCWMRIGLGLHLWSKGNYWLPKQLDKQAAPRNGIAVPKIERNATRHRPVDLVTSPTLSDPSSSAIATCRYCDAYPVVGGEPCPVCNREVS